MHLLILAGLFLGLWPSVALADRPKVWLRDVRSDIIQNHLQFFRLADDMYAVVWDPPKEFAVVGSPAYTAQEFWKVIRSYGPWHAKQKIILNFSPQAYGVWMELRAIDPQTQTMACTSNVGFHPSARAVLDAMGCRWKDWKD